MPRHLLGMLLKSRGASTTKLVVIVGGMSLLLIAGLYFGTERLVGDGTVAGREAAQGNDEALVYVLLTFAGLAFFAAFVTPVLFPRSHRARRKALEDLAEKFPFLARWLPEERRADARLEELRRMAAELENEQVPEGALDIRPADLGAVSEPEAETVSRDAPFQPTPSAPAIRHHRPAPIEEPIPTLPPLVSPSDEEITQIRTSSDAERDHVPFPSIGESDDSATIRIADPSDALDPTIHRVVDDAKLEAAMSARSAAAMGEGDVTVDRSVPSRDVFGASAVTPDAPTVTRDALTPDDLRETMRDERAPGIPEDTTAEHESFEP